MKEYTTLPIEETYIDDLKDIKLVITQPSINLSKNG